MAQSTSDAHCMICGDRLAWGDGFKSQSIRAKREGRPPEPNLAAGGRPVWLHADAMKRDHQAHPHDDRSHEEEAVRHAHRTGQAQMAVEKTLQRNFDYLHAENTINELFKDRRD